MSNLDQQALIAYHANCIDGFTSAFITQEVLVNKYDLNVTLFPMHYDEESTKKLLRELDTVEYAELFVVDFSLDIDVMRSINDSDPMMLKTILDHHKTAFERYNPGVEVTADSIYETCMAGFNIILDNSKCGAGICWEYFHGKAPVPTLVKYVQDYDLWQYEYGEHTKYVNKYLMTQCKTVGTWTNIMKAMENPISLYHILYDGEVLQTVHNNKVAELVDGAVLVYLNRIQGLLTHCEYKYASDVGHELAKLSETYGATWCMDINDKIKVSLRSNGDFDVSLIAKAYGGGGHKNAAGFMTDHRGLDILLGVDG